MAAVHRSWYIAGITVSTRSKGSFEPDDVTPARERSGLPPRLVIAAGLAAIDAGDAFVGRDERQQRERRLEQRRGAVDDRADRRVDRAEDVGARDQRAEPVREVDDFRRGDAREEILRAAREADHFVREDRPADEDVIVVDDHPIERDRHVLLQTAEAELFDHGRRDCPQRRRTWRDRPSDG